MIDELLEIYKSYRPELGVAQKRNEQLQSLNGEQFAQLEDVLLHHIQSSDEAQLALAEDVVSDLVLHTSFSVDSLLKAMLQAGYSPLDHLFREAGPQTESELFAMLEARTRPEQVMSALAWIDSENVTARFANWQREDAVALLDFYMFNAGWELDANYQRRWLFSKSCFGLSAASAQIGGSGPSSHDEKCRWCERPLFTLTDFPTAYLENIFGLESKVGALSIPFCMYCTLFEPVPMSLRSVNEDGRVDFSQRIAADKKIEQPNYKFETSGGILHLLIADSTRDCFSAVDSGRCYNLSQIGGFPTWPQDASYPHCVECGKTMLFFMQVESMDFPQLQYEGVYHFFICQHCPSEFAVQQSN